jgi:glycosyltransferase involved in cell wall biosynthesis
MEVGNKMRTIAVIPAYNESRTIADVVNRTLNHVDSVVVVNDQSTDNTEELAFEAGADTLDTKGKRGAGKAIRQGIDLALHQRADAIVLIDGDGQHDPDCIPDMLRYLKSYDMVVTSRFMDKLVLTNVPPYRRFGIWCITFAYNFLGSFKVKDSQCGLRAFRAQALKDMKLSEDGFGYSTEMLVKARARGYKIIEIPTVVFYHQDFKMNSTMNPLIHGLKVLWCTLHWRLKCEVFQCQK